MCLLRVDRFVCSCCAAVCAEGLFQVLACLTAESHAEIDLSKAFNDFDVFIYGLDPEKVGIHVSCGTDAQCEQATEKMRYVLSHCAARASVANTALDVLVCGSALIARLIAVAGQPAFCHAVGHDAAKTRASRSALLQISIRSSPWLRLGLELLSFFHSLCRH